jgi:hypothetical protein
MFRLRPLVKQVSHHTEYWSGKWPAGYQASQIQALQAAINLEDK